MVKENIEYNARLIGKLRMVNISLIFVPPECLGKRNYSELIIVVKIDLVTVFDAILTSRQTRGKLQCLYENLMSDNFRKTAVLKKISIVN